MRGPYDDGDARSGGIWMKNWGRTVVRPQFFTNLIPVMEEPLLQRLLDEIRENQVDRYEYRYTPGWRVLDDRYGPHECKYHILQGLAQKSEW